MNKDIAVRALKTFVQGFIAGWSLTNFDMESGAVVGAIAAGVSAVMNISVELYRGLK